jgi:hypothetical protein
MARLNDTERKEVVRRLACFESPTAVKEWASEELDKDLSIEQIAHYDPTRRDTTAEKWEVLFKRTREDFLSDLDNIPLSHRAVRLRELQRLYDRLKDEDEMEAARLLKQAAKEVGDKFTNRQELEHSGGFDVTIKPPSDDDSQ